MVATLHWRACSLSIDLRANEISATGSHWLFVQSQVRFQLPVFDGCSMAAVIQIKDLDSCATIHNYIWFGGWKDYSAQKTCHRHIEVFEDIPPGVISTKAACCRVGEPLSTATACHKFGVAI